MSSECPGARVLETRFPPPLLMMATGLAMWGVSRLSPLFGLPAPLAWLLPTLIATLSLALVAAGAIAFRRWATTIDPTRPAVASHLVTDGIYRFTRNPMYLGFAGLLLAWGLYLQAWWSLPLLLVFVLYITVFQIVPEERALEAKFGMAFEAYAAKVRRWL